MTKGWMVTYLAVLAAGSLGCFYSWGDMYEDDEYSYEVDDEDDYYDDYDSYDDSDDSYGYSSEEEFYTSADYGDGYHGRNAVRQALTAEAPEVDNSGYDESNYWGDCQVHAECPQGQVCASDPACPDYLYCYDVAEVECDCDDRFNTVCYFGRCIERGVDCDDGCPPGTVCIEEVGACAHSEGSASSEPTIDTPQDGAKCLVDSDCAQGQCLDGECQTPACGEDADCGAGQFCALAADGRRYCVIP